MFGRFGCMFVCMYILMGKTCSGFIISPRRADSCVSLVINNMMAFDFPFGLLAQLLGVEVLVDGEVWEDCGGGELDLGLTSALESRPISVGVIRIYAKWFFISI